MNFSELKGRAVIDVTSAKTIGHLDDLVVELENRQIIGLRVKESGLFGHVRAFPMTTLQSVGKDAVTILLPVETATSSKDTVLDKGPGLNSMINRQVVSQGGKLIGQISDIALDPTKLVITGYEIKESGLLSKKHSLPETPDLTFGPQMVVISDDQAAQLGSTK